jgi:hypothetical protein
MPNQHAANTSPTRRASLLALLGLITTGCGGGGSGGGDGSLQTLSITSQFNGTTYPLLIYTPPNSSAAALAAMPVVYLLDGDSRFTTMSGIAAASGTQVIVVGIGNEALRSRDFVPVNTCTPGGGGNAAYFDFIRLELTPFIEKNVGGDPKRRILLGHSHGGSFVLYAIFAQAAGSHHFATYLASDSSIDCMSTTVYGWEAAYAAANTSLPVRLHISYSANTANIAFTQQMQTRNYPGLTFVSKFYVGGHIGMIPQAFTEALAFALA